MDVFTIFGAPKRPKLAVELCSPQKRAHGEPCYNKSQSVVQFYFFPCEPSYHVRGVKLEEKLNFVLVTKSALQRQKLTLFLYENYCCYLRTILC